LREEKWGEAVAEAVVEENESESLLPVREVGLKYQGKK
jgi:hypothetical protein